MTLPSRSDATAVSLLPRPLQGLPARLRQGLFWVLLGVILVLALMPAPPRPPAVLAWDKLNHLVAFATLFVASWVAWPTRGWPWRQGLGLLAFGLLIELLQSFTPTREAEWGDVLADALGLALGGLVWAAWRGLSRR